MSPVPSGVRWDLLAFTLLLVALASVHVLRVRRPQAPGLTSTYRAGLWLLLWHGTGVALRVTGYA